jgi:hypothetical protein
MGQAALAAQNSNDGDNGGGIGSFNMSGLSQGAGNVPGGDSLKKQPPGL